MHGSEVLSRPHCLHFDLRGRAKSSNLVNLAMATVSILSPIETLPPELLTRVFDFLSCDRPHVDIANSRLVCRRFYALSSPFLIDTVVIADRQDTLDRLQEVLDHPYFSKHVTRLVWDASRYVHGPAEALPMYQRECEKSPWRSSTITAYCALHGKDVAELALLQDAVSVVRPGRRQHQAARAALAKFVDDIEGGIDSGRRSKIKELFEIAFHEYRRRFNAQLEIVALNLASKALHAVFDKLPKLRHVFYTDFRALARSGESLRGLCDRLFGQILSPELMPDDEQGFHDHQESGDDLKAFIRILANVSLSRLTSLSFGRGDNSSWDAPALGYYTSPRMVIPGLLTDETEQTRSLLRSILHLSLPVEISYLPEDVEVYWPVMNTQRLLSYTADTLTHLNLETGLYSGLHRDFFDLVAKAKAVFGEILGRIHFQALTTIVFRGWMFLLNDLEHFLLTHAGTLRNMHLINCCLADANKDELMSCIESTLEPALALTGVEIYALMYEARCLQRYRYKLRQRARHIQELPGEDEEEEQQMAPPRQQPRLDRTDLEELFLGGRRNAVARVKRGNSDLRARRRWWREIDSDDSDDEPDDPAPPISPSESSASDTEST